MIASLAIYYRFWVEEKVRVFLNYSGFQLVSQQWGQWQSMRRLNSIQTGVEKIKILDPAVFLIAPNLKFGLRFPAAGLLLFAPRKKKCYLHCICLKSEIARTIQSKYYSGLFPTQHSFTAIGCKIKLVFAQFIGWRKRCNFPWFAKIRLNHH